LLIYRTFLASEGYFLGAKTDFSSLSAEPGLTLLETAMHRRLAAADRVIALCLGHGAPPILSTPRGADDACRLACDSEVPHNITER
jgi:hypothetical protein